MKLQRQMKMAGFRPQLSWLYLDFQAHEGGTAEFWESLKFNEVPLLMTRFSFGKPQYPVFVFPKMFFFSFSCLAAYSNAGQEIKF